MSLASVHVPLLFYAPGNIEPGVYDRVAGELDLMPTIASFMGKSYVNQTLGRDLFEPDLQQTNAAFIFTPFRNPPRYGVVEKNLFAVRNPDGSSILYNLDENTETDIKHVFPEEAKRLIRLSEGYYEMARYMLYNNARK